MYQTEEASSDSEDEVLYVYGINAVPHNTNKLFVRAQTSTRCEDKAAAHKGEN